MDFETGFLEKQDGSQLQEISTAVTFEDAAELSFAMACLDTVRLYIELGSPDLPQSQQESLLKVIAEANKQLGEVVATAVELNRGAFENGVEILTTFGADDSVIASGVQIAVNLVATSAELRSYFPRDRIDLLTLFLPEQND